MKKAFFIIVAICLFASCDSQNQPADELIVGKWKVYKQTITGHFFNEQGDPVRGTREFPCSDSDYYIFRENGTVLYSSFPNEYVYTLQKQNDGTWQLNVEGLFDNHPSGRSPIVIHKISKDRIEWEYVVYGGDEGPDTYYQYLKRF